MRNRFYFCYHCGALWQVTTQPAAQFATQLAAQPGSKQLSAQWESDRTSGRHWTRASSEMLCEATPGTFAAVSISNQSPKS